MGKPQTKPLNRSLHAAKLAKQDEFYTQYIDIQKEVEAYLEFNPDTFRGKIVYCDCEAAGEASRDPFESNFFKYFAANFNKLGLKKLITTSYDGSPIAGQMSLIPEHTEGNGKLLRDVTENHRSLRFADFGFQVFPLAEIVHVNANRP